MEMENPRRSAVDRARELGLKRPRMAPPEDSPADRTSASSAASMGGRDRQFLASRAGGHQPSAPPRPPRAAEREEASRGAGSYQELLAQYKTALAELTFNSKPIITNLTIIAGENLHAAKGIAAIICANVLEVPSEQKLPSLYLLDSIVKNIGRDYIKQFSGRLPEVFCKAYKQVDSSVHSSMRHLFGTWKGIFPASPLQLIEKELGFTPVTNGSSGSMSSKIDSQSQGPHNSIHVNPKYLEARQRLQQTTRTKELGDNDISNVVSSERSDRTALVGRARQLENISTKMPNIQRPQREMVNDPIQDKKGLRNIKGLEFSSDIIQELDMGVGRLSDRIKEQDEYNKPYYGVNMSSSQSLLSRRNSFDVNDSYEAYQGSTSARVNNQLANNISVDRNSIGTSKSWQNSEEEEYIWDDMNSKTTDSGGSGSFMRSEWKNEGDDDDADKAIVSQEPSWHSMDMEPLRHKSKLDALMRSNKASKGEATILAYRDLEGHSTQPRMKHDNDPRSIEASPDSLYAQRTASEYQTNPKRVPHKVSLPAVGLQHKRSNCSQSEDYPFSYSADFSTNSGAFGQRLHQVQRTSASDVASSASVHTQHNKLPSVPNYRHIQHDSFSLLEPKPTHLEAQVNQMRPVSTRNHAQSLHMMSESLSSLSEPFQNPETVSTSSVTHSQLRDHHPLVQHSQPSESLLQPSLQNSRLSPLSQGSAMQQIGKVSATSNLDNLSIGASGHPDTSKLLAAIMKSGILPSTSVGDSQDSKLQPPLPKGPPPIQSLKSSAPSIPPSSLSFPDLSGNVTATKQLPERDMLPPLPPGPPPSSLQGTNVDGCKPIRSTVNPISTLLSSLVAKGLISSTSTELTIASVAKLSDNLKNERSYIASKTMEQFPSTLSVSNSFPALSKESSVPKTIAPASDVLSHSHSTKPELRDLIGIEFKPEIIRGSHPSVISSLFDDLKHQCDICGLRCMHEDDIQNHLDWHASKQSEKGNSRRSRRWYANASNWVNDTVTPQSGIAEWDIHSDEVVQSHETFEPMVPADERQSICVLCGEPFEDFYSEERDEWMYKGTTYLNLPNKEGHIDFVDKTTVHLPIVHAQCVA